MRLSNPSAEKGRARCGKYGCIIARDLVKGYRRQINQIVWLYATAYTLVTYVAISELEPGFLVVSLLGNDAVQAHIAPFHIGHSGIPKPQTKASPSILRLDDVETQEPVMLVVGNGGNAACRFAPGEFTDEESFRIGGIKAFRVIQTRVPAFGGSPFEGQVKLAFSHSSNNQLR